MVVRPGARDHNSQNQLYFTLGTPNDSNNSGKNHNHIWEILFGEISKCRDIENFDNDGNGGTRKLLKIRLLNS